MRRDDEPAGAVQVARPRSRSADVGGMVNDLISPADGREFPRRGSPVVT
jgi:hypothetical protein